MKRLSRIFLIALAASCNDLAELPVGPGGGTLPRLAAGDALTILDQREEGDGSPCKGRPAARTPRFDRTVYGCIPVAAHAAGIKRVRISVVQSEWSESRGAYQWVDIFTPVEIEESVAPTSARTYQPEMTPNGRGTAGSAIAHVTLVDAEGDSSTVSATLTLRSTPAASITEPDADEVFEAGGAVLAVTQVGNDLGVRRVYVRWSGVAEAEESVLLPGLPTDTTLLHALQIPADAESGTLDLVVVAEDAAGIPSDTARRSFEVYSLASDSTNPSLEYAGIVPARLAEGDSLVLRARDGAGVSRVGYVITRTSDHVVLHGDSITTEGAATEETASFHVVYPAGFPYGQIRIVAFAEDSRGNRGWAAGALVPGTDSLAAARGIATEAVMGRHIPFAASEEITAAAAHRERGEVYFANRNRSRIERLDVATAALLSPVAVGSAPTDMVVLPGFGGAQATRLLVSTGGSNEISVVDLVQGERVASLPVAPLRFRALRQVDETEVDTTLYAVGNRPARLAATCRNFLCTTHNVFATNRTSASEPYAIVRAFALSATNGLSNDAVVMPPVDASIEARGDDSGPATIEVLDVAADGQLVFRYALSGRSPTSTFHTGAGARIAAGTTTDEPSIAIAQEAGSAIDHLGARLIRTNPTTGYEGKTVLATDFSTEGSQGFAFVAANDDFSRILALTDARLLVLDADLNAKAEITASGENVTRPSAAAFLSGHRASHLSAEEGAMLAVARSTGPWIDVYETVTYQRIATLPTKEMVASSLLFLRTDTEGSVAIVGRSENGILLIKTTLDALLQAGSAN